MVLGILAAQLITDCGCRTLPTNLHFSLSRTIGISKITYEQQYA